MGWSDARRRRFERHTLSPVAFMVLVAAIVALLVAVLDGVL